MAPGRKFWTSTSAEAASFFRTSTPRGSFRSTTIERLPRLLLANSPVTPLRWLPR